MDLPAAKQGGKLHKMSALERGGMVPKIIDKLREGDAMMKGYGSSEFVWTSYVALPKQERFDACQGKMKRQDIICRKNRQFLETSRVENSKI